VEAVAKHALSVVSASAVRKEESPASSGPNGAGKTTIIKIPAGLILHEQGSISMLGVPLQRFSLDLRSWVGLLTSNDRSFYWRLTGRQNIDFFATMYGFTGKDRTDHVGAVPKDVGMEADADKPFRLYLTGMVQRCCSPELFSPGLRYCFRTSVRHTSIPTLKQTCRI